MSTAAVADVRFDWTGSLPLARRLWKFADQLVELRSRRERDASDASAAWSGRAGDDFDARISTELGELAAGVDALRTAANEWAKAWAKAMNEQNWRRFAREVKRVERDRNFLESAWAWGMGADDLPPEPRELAVPCPPQFVETGSFVRY